ncbi:MAG TPA: alpha/beta hydrolase [Actinomycetota bacterium]|jgi:pimeloyl-ACP methyl ester carboxylesterase|nr:alpha/beta hydrolase [Actinomycetota bacterium]
MKTYALLPGACHGPWCWTATIAALDERGHRAIAIDLPCDDVTAGFDRYVEVTRDALDGAGDDIVLVGHSLGAHTAVRASHLMPVAAVLFVCGVIPPREGEDTSGEPHLDADGAFEGLELDADGRIFFPDPADAIRDFLPDVDEETAAWAAAQLKPQSTTPHQHINDQVGPPSGLCASIVCTDDRVATAAWGRWAAHERLLDAPVVELPGSHSTFLSRPADLADALVELRGRL